jgi:hypothetical protein
MAYRRQVPDRNLKPVVQMGNSLGVLRTFPSAVQDEVGYALYLAQWGEKHASAKPPKGVGPGVLEGSVQLALSISCDVARADLRSVELFGLFGEFQNFFGGGLTSSLDRHKHSQLYIATYA